MKKRDWKGNRIGLYVTVIFHFTVIVFLVGSSLKSTLERTDDILIELLSEQEMEELQKLEEMERLKKLSEEGEASVYEEQLQEIRNMAVDESGELKDDRGTKADELYAEHEKLMKELEEGRKKTAEDADDEVALPQEENQVEEKEIPNVIEKGNYTIEFNVEGRRPVYYRIPAYKCMKGGTVTVQVIVAPNGKVIDAKVIDGQSDTDDCLRKAAIQSAYIARFKASDSAGPKSPGTITFKFIRQ